MSWYFIYAGVALGGTLTVVMNVVLPANAKIIAKPKENTVRPKRVKRPTDRLKIDVATV